MTIDQVTAVMSQGLCVVITVSAPILLISLVVGLTISIFQTVTSIQEQTLTFVPKVICVFLGLMLLGNWMLTELTDYMNMLWGDFSIYIR